MEKGNDPSSLSLRRFQLSLNKCVDYIDGV